MIPIQYQFLMMYKVIFSAIAVFGQQLGIDLGCWSKQSACGSQLDSRRRVRSRLEVRRLDHYLRGATYHSRHDRRRPQRAG